jgi:hypothetical protein
MVLTVQGATCTGDCQFGIDSIEIPPTPSDHDTGNGKTHDSLYPRVMASELRIV